MHTAAYSFSSLESDPKEKKNTRQIREDVPTQALGANIESTGLAQEHHVFFLTDDV